MWTNSYNKSPLIYIYIYLNGSVSLENPDEYIKIFKSLKNKSKMKHNCGPNQIHNFILYICIYIQLCRISGIYLKDKKKYKESKLCLIIILFIIIIIILGLPWWRSGWESACQCGGHGFEPWSGKIPHAAEQLGPWATIAEPARLEPVLHNKRGRDSERPAHSDEEWPPLAATRESRRTEMKTQHRQK